MAFFTEKTLNPKRKFRWVVDIGTGNDTNSILRVAAKSVQKPNYTLETTQHKFLNHQFNYPNRVIWQPIDITFVDHLGRGGTSVSSRLYALLLSSGYQIPANPFNCELSPTKNRAVGALGSVKIVQLSGDAGRARFTVDEIDGRAPGAPQRSDVIETWTLGNAFISKVTFGDLSYDDDGLVEIQCTFTYDYAEFQGK